MKFNILKKLLSIMLLMTMLVNLNCSACIVDSKISQKQVNNHVTSIKGDEPAKEEQSKSTSLTLNQAMGISSVVFGIVGFIVGCFLPSCCRCSCF